MSRHKVLPNPLADAFWNELDPILAAIYAATPSVMLEGCRNGGVQVNDDNTYRPSTDDEFAQVEFSLIPDRITLNARQPMFAQLSDWLKQIADQIDEARAGLERIEGIRDQVVIPRKKARSA